MFISICIPSYKRPEGLRRLLEALAAQQLPTTSRKPALVPDVEENSEPSSGATQSDNEIAVEVCVADNDPERSATAVCRDMRENYRWPLHCEPEETRGLSPARNKSLELASPECDFFAFVDDDEVPEPDWLQRLLETQHRTGADVVTGPVLGRFDQTPPKWVTDGGYFSTARMPTGTSLDFAATGNALVRASAIRSLDGDPFDLRLSHIGGEDTHLFMRLKQRGCEIIWCDEAVIYEQIPVERVGMHWLLRRGARSFGTFSACSRELNGWATVPAGLAKGCVRIAIGVVTLPLVLVGGKLALVKSLLNIWRGTGRIFGCFGTLPREYK